ncbi:MAG TPA: S4 domain-containing protein [Saprospiraceae bacterium]|nr:S4 domain-containing protein [Saprospiraceae bacterium]
MDRVRVDKWLWSVRIFKSRTKASDACKEGRVSIGDKRIKPSHWIGVGDEIHIKKEGFNLVFRVEKLLKTRVSAVLASPCYTHLTPSSELNKFKDWYIGKSTGEFRERGLGRPTKKERREISSFKDEFLLDWDD